MTRKQLADEARATLARPTALWMLRNDSPPHPLRRKLDRMHQRRRIDERQDMLDSREEKFL